MTEPKHLRIQRAISRLVVPMLAVFALLTACRSGEIAPQPPTSPPGEVATPLPTSPAVEPSPSTPPTDPNILFQDEFTSPSPGWTLVQSLTSIQQVLDGELRAFVDNAEFPYAYPIALAEGTFGDVRIEADVRWVSGSDKASAYLICRRAEERSYIFGAVDSEGEARIGLVSGDMQEILADEVEGPGLHNGSNHLRLECLGDQVSLYLDGVLVASVEVDGPNKGQVGLAAGGATLGQTDFYFDHFIVYRGDF